MTRRTSGTLWVAAALMLTLGTTLAMAAEPKAETKPAAPTATTEATPMPGGDMPGMGHGMGMGMHGAMGGPGMHAGAGMCGPGCGGGKGMMAGGGCGPQMRRERDGRGGQGMAMVMKELGLTDAQRDKVTEIHERVARQNVQTEADLKLAAMDLQKLMRADKPDAKLIGAQIDKLAALRATMQKARVQGHLEMRGLLTPEQLKKAKEMHGGGAMPMMGPGMGMGFDDEGDEPEDGADDGIGG
jgi:Spy/CpxP family protein refolding chaperone